METKQRIYRTLQIAAAMCFIGHGAFGIITKEIWCNYFAVVGIDHDSAYHLMPVLGIADILMGLSLVFYPVRAVFLWLVLWGLGTAAMRPLSGEPLAELLERAGNFGVPLAILCLCPPVRDLKTWFEKIEPPRGPISAERLRGLTLVLRLTAMSLLAGHGWLNLLGKKSLLSQYMLLGFHDPQQVAFLAETIEIAAALVVAVRPLRPLIFFFLVWKMGTELFYPQWELFEWVERGGSYGTLLALWFAMEPAQRSDSWKHFMPTIFYRSRA